MGKATTVLLVLDGIGISDSAEYNAFYEAKTPVLNRLMRGCPYVRGLSAGMAVGLPNGQAGNAEAGFMNMGAGRIVYQELTRINKEISSGAFFNNEVLLETMNYCRRNDSSLHLMGLLSDGGVHSHIDHLYALLEMAKRNGLNRVYVHCFTDGRDTERDSGLYYIERLQSRMRELGTGEIATVSGRFYAMDRDNNFDRIKLVYLAMTMGEGNKAANAAEAVQAAYDNGETDEFIRPTVIVNGGVPVGAVNDDDALIFFNFRPDRARELTKAFCDEEFRMFKRDSKPYIRFVCFNDYDPLTENKYVAFESQTVYNTFGEYLSICGRTQLRLAESENASNVLRFFDCDSIEAHEGEDRVILRSAKDIVSYAKRPEMNTASVCEKLTESISSGKYDFILCNMSNADMTGHTADMDSAKKACEGLDECVGIICDSIIENDGVLFICSTHGNVECLYHSENDKPVTYHTNNPVPFILFNYDAGIRLREGGCPADIVPTLLEVMGLSQPKEMTGKTLIIRE
ncbi:MAG: 2,3-bisphosphoglycerate-independent phosphoglycerate mutase [Lachnospiraceae bacterium]|nr:2,3-bisphosphoglycerate-independent phosphoglycerate mutase [Lachnospiraceae bacterium]